MQELLDARVELRLTPPDVARIGRRIRPVVGFGVDERSCEVKLRYAKVLALVNEYLPPGADPVETWSLHQLRPVNLTAQTNNAEPILKGDNY